MFSFKLLHQDKKTKARVGRIHTPHGTIETPAFVPVGTQGSVKSLTPEELKELDVDVFFVNTYHMYLRPGMDVIQKFGGLHKFIGWNGPLMTDSGGFQVFSLARGKKMNFESGTRLPARQVMNHGENKEDQDSKFKIQDSNSLVKITDDGVEFRSHWDGSKHMFTPKFSMELQWQLGADIHIAFDDCPPYPVTHEKAKRSMERTHRWAKESLDAHKKLKIKNLKLKIAPQALYGSIQGSTFEDLRKESAQFISSLDFDGLAIGGVAVGESKKEMVNVLDWVAPILPSSKPRHLLGVGEIDDIFELVERGMDTFDCVQPTRLARMGRLLCKNYPMKKFEIDITNKKYAQDVKPIEKNCQCYTCQHFSRAYLHHLFRVRELLAYRLATIHNMYYINTLMVYIRKAIADGTFLELKRQWLYNK